MFQMSIHLKRFFVSLACLLCFSAFAGFSAMQTAVAGEPLQCPNCGMILEQWAHTNHEFSNSEGQFRTCSIHCVADMSVKSGEEPKNVRVTLHLSPQEMIPAESATYVIGSKDPGTMTMVSKLAFKSRTEAEKFSAEKGGNLGSFSDALAAAEAELPKAKPMIQAKRKETGKIADPADEDHCPVCNMFPARYPKENAQVLTMDKKRYQFCSTQCLFGFIQKPEDYGAAGAKLMAVWVHDYTSGRYIYGKNAYYVVGSDVLGPMGYEAIAFDLKSDAADFAKTKGGRVLKFDQVDPEKIRTK